MSLRNSSCFRFLIALGIALAMLTSTSCSGHKATGEDEAPDSGVNIAEVTVTQVTRSDISARLTVTGTVAALPSLDVKVSSLVAGRIARLNVTEGDRVAKDQVLAVIDDRPYRDQLQQAEAAIEQAKANLENATLNRERNETLFKRGIAARKDVEDARTQESVSKASLSQAEAQLAYARLEVSRTEVRSPLTGTVVKRFVSSGEQVDGTAAQPLFEVVNLRQAELYGNVSALYLSQIHVGQEFSVTADSFPGRNFAGRVVAISPAVDSSTNVGLVRIRIDNRDDALRLGMFLTAEVPLETHKNTLVVPPQAVYRDDQGRTQVFRVHDGMADAIQAKLGIETHDQVELLSGVKEGDTIILTGGYGLGEHTKVKVQP